MDWLVQRLNALYGNAKSTGNMYALNHISSSSPSILGAMKIAYNLSWEENRRKVWRTKKFVFLVRVRCDGNNDMETKVNGNGM